MRTNKNDLEVNANFDSGTFINFEVYSTKNHGSYNPMDYNLKNVEKLTFEDFTALEIVIEQAVSNFLDMKHREILQTEADKFLDKEI